MMHQNTAESSLDPEKQLALDWSMFESVDAAAAATRCRVWHASQPVVVVGRHGRVEEDVIEANCGADRVPVLRRVSGGGAVVLGPGCLNYAVVLSLTSQPRLSDVADSFQLILRAIVEALDVPGLTIEAGTDLVLRGRKVSGNAQRRGRRALLHHGTLLYDFDARMVSRYLQEPVRRPAYRSGRRHGEFIGNLPLSDETIRVRLDAAWRALGHHQGATLESTETVNRRSGD
jgi:lipoate-protein ligase A